MIMNLDFIYPIGSIYMNLNDINPSKIFGGTWERIPFRYLVGAGTIEKNSYDGYGSVDEQAGTYGIGAGATFGEIFHTLTINEIPSHTHSIDGHNGDGSGAPFPVRITGGEVNWNSWVSTGATGGGQRHNNLPPSLSVYMWKRIA